MSVWRHRPLGSVWMHSWFLAWCWWRLRAKEKSLLQSSRSSVQGWSWRRWRSADRDATRSTCTQWRRMYVETHVKWACDDDVRASPAAWDILLLVTFWCVVAVEDACVAITQEFRLLPAKKFYWVLDVSRRGTFSTSHQDRHSDKLTQCTCPNTFEISSLYSWTRTLRHFPTCRLQVSVWASSFWKRRK